MEDTLNLLLQSGMSGSFSGFTSKDLLPDLGLKDDSSLELNNFNRFFNEEEEDLIRSSCTFKPLHGYTDGDWNFTSTPNNRGNHHVCTSQPKGPAENHQGSLAQLGNRDELSSVSLLLGQGGTSCHSRDCFTKILRDKEKLLLEVYTLRETLQQLQAERTELNDKTTCGMATQTPPVSRK